VLLSEDVISQKYNSLVIQLKLCIDKGLGLQEITQIKFDNNSDKLLLELLLNYLVKVETISPGSSTILVDMLSGIKSTNVDTARLSKENIHSLISTFADESITSIIVDSLELSGIHGKIILGNHIPEGNKDVVELTNGSFFSDVLPALKIKNSKFNDPKVIVIDGFIESVSEIHHLLEDASKLKEHIILFIRGLSDEVVHTIKVNNDRGTFSVIPLICKYDLVGANLLNDVAIVSGCDVVSTHKGNLISNIDLSASKRIDSIIINDTGVLIENKGSSNVVNRHIRFLQEKANNANNDAEATIIANRIKNLGSRRVTISLKQDQNKKKRSFMVDQSIRAVKMSSTYGITKFEGKMYPLTSVKVALHYKQKVEELFSSVGCLFVE